MKIRRRGLLPLGGARLVWCCLLLISGVRCVASPIAPAWSRQPRAPGDTRPAAYIPPGWPSACRFPDCALPGTFETPDQAALNAFDDVIDHISDWKQFEYAGCIFQVADGRYRATLAVTLSPPSSKVCLPPSPPQGTKLMGDYHNHTSREDFSEDPDKSSQPPMLHYLLTPSGRVLRYDPTTQQVLKLR